MAGNIYTLDGKDLIVDQNIPHYFVNINNNWIEVVDEEDAKLVLK